MTTPPSDYLADLFGLPPASPQSATEVAAAAEAAEAALAAAEAELAAEFAATMDAGGFAADAPDSRSRQRVRVSWSARMRLPDGRVVELEVRNISESGMGLMTDEDIPARTVVAFQMDVPRPGEDGKFTLVEGTIKTTYAVAHGAKILCGGTWQVPPVGLELVNLWIERLRD